MRHRTEPPPFVPSSRPAPRAYTSRVHSHQNRPVLVNSQGQPAHEAQLNRVVFSCERRPHTRALSPAGTGPDSIGAMVPSGTAHHRAEQPLATKLARGAGTPLTAGQLAITSYQEGRFS